MLKIVIPAADSELADVIWPGSGVVASPHQDTGRLRVDFEGDDDVYPTYADRVARAAERHQWARQHRSGYPTTACAFVESGEVVTVGSYDPESGQLTITDDERLAAWLGMVKVPNSELQRTRNP